MINIIQTGGVMLQDKNLEKIIRTSMKSINVSGSFYFKCTNKLYEINGKQCYGIDECFAEGNGAPITLATRYYIDEATGEIYNKFVDNYPVTLENAIQGVKKIENLNCIYDYDHEEVKNGSYYYIIHVYEMVINGNIEHTATAGWYAVEKNIGKIYDNIFDINHLKPLN